MTNTHKVGLVFAVVMGGWHLIWSLMVLSGIGQKFLEVIMWAHMINFTFTVGPFDLRAALVLILVTAVIGYLLGVAVAIAWKKIHG